MSSTVSAGKVKPDECLSRPYLEDDQAECAMCAPSHCSLAILGIQTRAEACDKSTIFIAARRRLGGAASEVVWITVMGNDGISRISIEL